MSLHAVSSVPVTITSEQAVHGAAWILQRHAAYPNAGCIGHSSRKVLVLPQAERTASAPDAIDELALSNQIR